MSLSRSLLQLSTLSKGAKIEEPHNPIQKTDSIGFFNDHYEIHLCFVLKIIIYDFMIILKEYRNPIFRRTHLATVEVVKHTLIKTGGDLRRDTMVSHS